MPALAEVVLLGLLAEPCNMSFDILANGAVVALPCLPLTGAIAVLSCPSFFGTMPGTCGCGSACKNALAWNAWE
eukprot:scaffold61789_cov21-Tisochrysis_lutea.AAC.4